MIMYITRKKIVSTLVLLPVNLCGNEIKVFIDFLYVKYYSHVQIKHLC